MSQSNELVTIEPSNVLTVFTTEKGLDPLLAKVKDEIDGFKPDITTKKGRDAIASIAYKVSQTKSYLDKTGKTLTDKLKAQPKAVDAERKRMRDLLDSWRDEVRKPLTEMEDAEKDVLNKIEYLCLTDDLNSDQILSRLNEVSSIDIEFAVIKVKELEKAKQDAAELLTKKHQDLKAQEEVQAEIERLQKEAAEREQKEREERIARESAEKAKLEAEQKAKAEQERVERERLHAIEAAEKAERHRIESEQRAERMRIEAEQRAEREKQELIESQKRQAEHNEKMRLQAEQQAKAEAEEIERKRLANKEHRRSVNNEILNALKDGGISEDIAKEVITLAAQGLTGRLQINY